MRKRMKFSRHGIFRNEFMSLETQEEDRIQLGELKKHFLNLSPDPYLDQKFGERYRAHSSAVISDSEITWIQPDHFLQKSSENKLFGGLKRKFPPVSNKMLDIPVLIKTIFDCREIYCYLFGETDLEIGLHIIRTKAFSGRPAFPAPEGIHRDGFQAISVHLINRSNISQDGGRNYLFRESQKNPFASILLENTGDALFINDSIVRHDVLPFEPLDISQPALRDILVLTYGPKLERAPEPGEHNVLSA